MTPRVAVFGGSFDPVHRAHLVVAQRALDQLALESVWFLPARWAAHKAHRRPTPSRHRLAMLELALAGHDGFSICPLELEAPEGQRSVDTLRELHRIEPGVQFFFLMGEDSFRALDGWREPGELARLANLVVQARPPEQGDRPTHFAGQPVHWLEGEPLEFSSTALREQLATGSGRDALAPGVHDYILDHGLYSVDARGEST